MKNQITLLFFFFALAFAPLGLSAQWPIWGAGFSNPTQDSIARFASSDGTLTSLGWSSTGTSATGACNWIWSQTGQSAGVYAPGWVNAGSGQWINSTSISNGCALFDSDWWDSNGTGPGAGTAQGPQYSTLISPVIDMTGYTDSLIQVNFFVSYLEFTISELSVGLSVDGGTTWTDVDFRNQTGGQGVRAWFNDSVTVYMPPILDGVINLTNCRLRFTFNGNYYFVAVDDISITTRGAGIYDLAIAQHPSADYGYLTTANPAVYKHLPLSQVAGNDFFAGSLIESFGRSVYWTQYPRLNYEIYYENAGVWTSIWSGVDTLQSLLPNVIGAFDTITTLKNISAAVDTLHDQPGHYRIDYWVQGDFLSYARESRSENDSASVEYWISDETFTFCDLDSSGSLAANRYVLPGAGGGQVVQEFEYGSLFKVPNGNGYYLDSVSYQMYADASLNSSTVTEVPTVVSIYKWVDVNTDGSIDYSTEFFLQSSVNDTIPITSSTPGTYITRSVALLDTNPPVGNPLALQDSSLYYVSVTQVNVNGLIDLGGNHNGLWHASCSFDENKLNQRLADQAYTPLRVKSDVPGGTSGTNDWYSSFAGSMQYPAISLTLTDCAMDTSVTQSGGTLTANATGVTYQWLDCDNGNAPVAGATSASFTPVNSGNYAVQLSDGVCVWTSSCVNVTAMGTVDEWSTDIQLFPNPATDQVKITFGEVVNRMEIALIDLNGRILLKKEFSGSTEGELNLGSIPAGVYLVRMNSDNSVRTIRLVKQ